MPNLRVHGRDRAILSHPRRSRTPPDAPDPVPRKTCHALQQFSGIPDVGPSSSPRIAAEPTWHRTPGDPNPATGGRILPSRPPAAPLQDRFRRGRNSSASRPAVRLHHLARGGSKRPLGVPHGRRSQHRGAVDDIHRTRRRQAALTAQWQDLQETTRLPRRDLERGSGGPAAHAPGRPHADPAAGRRPGSHR